MSEAIYRRPKARPSAEVSTRIDSHRAKVLGVPVNGVCKCCSYLCMHSLTEWSYSQGFMLMIARQNVSKSSRVRVMGEYTAGIPSCPGILVGFPVFRNRCIDALIV